MNQRRNIVVVVIIIVIIRWSFKDLQEIGRYSLLLGMVKTKVWSIGPSQSSAAVNLENFSSPTGWVISAAKAKLESIHYPIFEEPSNMVVFTFSFKRSMFYDPVSGILWKVCFICLKQIRFYAYDLNIIVLPVFSYLFPSYDWKLIQNVIAENN